MRENSTTAMDTKSSRTNETLALDAVAHPDDIELMMAGTMLELRQAGSEIHFWNLANGCCGSVQTGREETSSIRAREAAASAAKAGAAWHEPRFDDLGVFMMYHLRRSQ